MKRSLIWTLILGLVALGGALMLARRGSAATAAEDDAPLFRTQPQGAGRRIQLLAREPLRGVRWLPPIAGGWFLCQVSTQSDRQLVGLFQEGQLAHTFSLPRPEGIPEGFYRQAEIRDALVVSDTLLLLVQAEGGRREVPVVMALTLEGDLRWAGRAQADHLAAADSAVWAWGATGAQHLPLALAKGERANRKAGRAGMPEPLTWPMEAAAPTSFLSTSSGFLISHSRGLSAWRSDSGWVHTPGPAPSPLGFRAPKDALIRCGTTLYWQPEPGVLFKVASDAQVLGPEPLPIPDPAKQDSALLRLLGCDAEGSLWFGLASPSLPTAPQASLPEVDALWNPPMATPTLSAEARADYEAHLRAPMDRIYAWKPGDKSLRAIIWSQAWLRLDAPPAVAPPSGDGELRPEARGFLFGTGQERWWLSLRVLP